METICFTVVVPSTLATPPPAPPPPADVTALRLAILRFSVGYAPRLVPPPPAPVVAGAVVTGALYFFKFLLMSDFLRLQVRLSFRMRLPAASANLVRPMGRAGAVALMTDSLRLFPPDDPDPPPWSAIESWTMSSKSDSDSDFSVLFGVFSPIRNLIRNSIRNSIQNSIRNSKSDSIQNSNSYLQQNANIQSID